MKESWSVKGSELVRSVEFDKGDSLEIDGCGYLPPGFGSGEVHDAFKKAGYTRESAPTTTVTLGDSEMDKTFCPPGFRNEASEALQKAKNNFVVI
jgi:hypothetical protein